MSVNYIYTNAWKCVQRCINDHEDYRMKEEDSFEYSTENDYKRGSANGAAARISVENIILVKTDELERKIRINYNVFKNSLHFFLKFRDFLKELAALSEKLVVQIDDVDKTLFLNFLLDSFNLFGEVEGLIDVFRPTRLTPVQRSGLTSEEMLRTLFLLQNIDDGMRVFLSFNVFAISIYHGDRYVGSLLDNIYKKIIVKLLFKKRSSYEDPSPEAHGKHGVERLEFAMKRCMMVKPLLNGLYLLFDIFNVDDVSLRDIFRILLTLVTKERGMKLVNFLGLNDLFICAVKSICEDLVPSHLLMIACRDKLNMKYKAASMGLSIDYVYNWIYKPHLTIMMPQWFSRSRSEGRNLLVMGRPIEAISDKVTVEFTKEDKESSSARGPAYSPLSRRLSTGLRDRSPNRFRSKQKLDFSS
ncbi:hypothetical protein EROM_090310 [Encephalitozoon romaleae SJ-2008]|uniref:Uncharacterized protein n=1 Tax=Encephalitozoon romaleae (strain SJ-2008) TaxID=1178016 RepID=I6ZK70_ENCRO|nr:hypothetical protein EROM_090310 [Encephalitozoon romaleae SJ-2008]AFN83648.1 hypothetical protein EROM_090310 [Encephalitozoon romaleae SJ-2008]